MSEEQPEHSNWFVRAGGWTRSIKFIIAIFALLLMGSILFQYTAQRDDVARAQDTLDQLTTLADQGIEQRKALQKQAELILDCTKAGGDCFEKAQKKTAEVVQNLNIVTEFSVICGEREDGEMAILDCVNREVKDFLRVQEEQQAKNG
jgi:hypothetical protein